MWFMLVSSSVHASFQNRIKFFLIKIVGEERAFEVFKWQAVEFPVIPKVTENATSIKQVEIDQREGKIQNQRRMELGTTYLAELYEVTRNIKASSNDMAKWFQALSHGASREGIYRALVLDSTYAGLENYNVKITEETLSFAHAFSERFLDKKYSDEQMTSLGLYSLKRIFVEKVLEIIENYELNDQESFFRWYAHFSFYLAKDFKNQWDIDIRKNASLIYHYEWAKKVPIQFVKSEVIIKLHKIFNKLNNQQLI